MTVEEGWLPLAARGSSRYSVTRGRYESSHDLKNPGNAADSLEPDCTETSFAKIEPMRTRTAISAVLTGAALGSGALLLSAPAQATRCTDQLDYSGDPRSNAEINSIGATTGQCPTPMTGVSNDVPGLVSGAVLGQPCTNTQRFVFGQTAAGDTLLCTGQGSAGTWIRSIPVIGTRPLGSSCTEGFELAAQTPDGIPIICGDGVWVRN